MIYKNPRPGEVDRTGGIRNWNPSRRQTGYKVSLKDNAGAKAAQKSRSYERVQEDGLECKEFHFELDLLL